MNDEKFNIKLGTFSWVLLGVDDWSRAWHDGMGDHQSPAVFPAHWYLAVAVLACQLPRYAGPCTTIEVSE